MGKKKEKMKKKEEGLMPEAAYDVNGPDDVEIGDGITPYEILKKKEEQEKKG